MIKFQYLIALLFILITSASLKAQSSIAEIQGKSAVSPFAGETVTVKGLVTAAKSGAGYFIQDGDSVWSAIYVYDTTREPYPEIGDSVQLTALVTEYYEMTELKDVSEIEILSKENRLPQPILLKAEEISEAYESVLITVQGMKCTSESLGYGEWEISDETGSVVVNDLFYAYAPTLNELYNVTGPLNYSFSAFKIEPPTAEDITIGTPLYFVNEPFQIDADTASITLYWTTNAASNTIVEFGKTSALEIDTLAFDDLTLEHTVKLENLEAGELYFVNAYSVADDHKTLSSIQAYTTVSKSSGDMNFVFGPVFNCPTMKSTVVGDLTSSIISFINQAQNTLDIAIYDVENYASYSDQRNQDIFNAVLDKAAAGVQVRVITDDQSVNEFFTDLEVNAKVVKGNVDGIMHHKFLVIDGESMDRSTIVTGSVNWTYNNLVMDFNNLVSIQDRSLAKAYTLEFNEMWGSETFEPNINESKFGSEKTNNTPHQFKIGGKQVELYFSPSDNTEQKIIQAIDSADYEISFTMMAFTSDGIANAIKNAFNRGVKVEYSVIDYVDYSGSEYNNLLNAGIAVHDYVSANGKEWPEGSTVHDKYMIIDYDHPESDPMVITGTHNWTASADSRNDENTLFIHDYETAQTYLKESIRIYSGNYCNGSSVNEIKNFSLIIGPNPVHDLLYFNADAGIEEYVIYSITGSIVQQGALNNQLRGEIEINHKLSGQYLLEMRNVNGMKKQLRLNIY